MIPPIRFAFGIHLHQPVGNFDSVFAQHVEDVYRPFLERVDERDFLPITIHLSGSLLEWLEQHEQGYLDFLGRLVSDGRVELLLAGFYEPVLASLPRRDRVEQVQWMRDAILRRFGVDATGLWLTERVWEPELAADLADAGVRYALVDDRHFLVTGFERSQLHAPYLTESDGKRIALFPIDERLRYLIPFQPPADTATYLRELRAAGHRLAVLADDGEKFGGWPGTKEWVYGRGWLDQFLTTMGALVDSGEVMLTTFAEALRSVPPAGLAYLPTASYREMEGWALPPAAARRLGALERELGEERIAGPEGSLIRGAHWRNFFVKYSESNRMHKKMMALSELCRRSGDPAAARRAIGRAQCNDAYWHGVFGGLYLPHLRDGIWRQLAIAEGLLRQDEALTYELLDLDCDGSEEIWIHGDRMSALVSPARGGAIEEFTIFALETNFANVLTRRREGYHEISAPETASVGLHDESGAPSIHDLETSMRLHELPPLDAEDRVLLTERILGSDISRQAYERGDYDPAWRASGQKLGFEITPVPGAVLVIFRSSDAGRPVFEKEMRFREDGSIAVEYRWNPAMFPTDSCFAPELSWAGPLELVCTPGTEMWVHNIDTIAKSERGLEETVQGRSATPR
ncbi:MAG: alpha-amylase/4-alpha-glucanotransferase domain-containing protein, partial [Gemmatimonadota bacterium]